MPLTISNIFDGMFLQKKLTAFSRLWKASIEFLTFFTFLTLKISKSMWNYICIENIQVKPDLCQTCVQILVNVRAQWGFAKIWQGMLHI